MMNWWLHSGQKFISSFGLPWSKWSGNSDPSKSLSSQRSTHPKWHRFLSKQFIGQTPLHHIHKFSFHWNLVIHKHPATVGNPMSCKYLPQFPVWYLECMGQASGMQLWIADHNKSVSVLPMSAFWVSLISWSWVPPIARLKLQQKGQASGMLL